MAALGMVNSSSGTASAILNACLSSKRKHQLKCSKNRIKENTANVSQDGKTEKL
jgi:hypothetical protein